MGLLDGRNKSLLDGFGMGLKEYGILGMNQKTVQKLIQKKQTEDFLRQDFEQTLPDRVSRYLEVKPHEVIPLTPFACASSECSLLFRDGHFYGCIALTQAVAEAIVRLLCQKNNCSHTGKFEEKIERVHKKRFISDNVKKSLLKIWERRNDYHHLNPNVETSNQKLKELAKEKACLIVEIEREIFSYKLVDGVIIPDQPRYWENNSNQVFLRITP